jgi:hypothetical protein
MERRESAGFAQRGGEEERVFHRDAFVFHGVPEEAGRGILGDLEFAREELYEFLIRLGAEEVFAGAGVGEFE